MEKINIAELLKDCPKGMELDCVMFENLHFDFVENQDKTQCIYPIRCYVEDNGFRHCVRFTKYGESYAYNNAKCVIFPKGKTTWEGFQRPFKDGDIVATESGKQIFVCRDNQYCYFGWDFRDKKLFGVGLWVFCRLATEAEKQKLFDAIKANGYRWDEETKKLEKLAEPKFKVWDIVQCITDSTDRRKIEEIDTLRDMYRTDSYSIRFEDEDDWNLVPDNVEPKFKVGDRIKDKDGYIVTITEVSEEDECYEYESLIAKGIGCVAFSEEDEWELVPNKFDITTLKPFDKVLVKDCYDKDAVWECDFFSHVRDNEDFVTVGGVWKYCIPYEMNKELHGTADDCDEYYKIWE